VTKAILSVDRIFTLPSTAHRRNSIGQKAQPSWFISLRVPRARNWFFRPAVRGTSASCCAAVFCQEHIFVSEDSDRFL